MASTSSTPQLGVPAVLPRRRRRSEIGSLDSASAAVTILQTESTAFFGTGHVLFARDETLMAQPFDPDTRQFTGEAFPVAEHVRPEGSRVRRCIGFVEWHAGVRQ